MKRRGDILGCLVFLLIWAAGSLLLGWACGLLHGAELPPLPPAPKLRAKPISQGAAAAQNLAAAKVVMVSKPVVAEWYWTPSTNYAYIVQRSTNLVTWQSVTGYSAAVGNLQYPIRFRFTNNLPCEFFRRLDIPLFHVDLKRL